MEEAEGSEAMTTPLEAIVYMVISIGVVLLYQILRRLDLILDLLLRSLPLHAVALVPPEDEPGEGDTKKRFPIQGFRPPSGNEHPPQA